MRTAPAATLQLLVAICLVAGCLGNQPPNPTPPADDVQPDVSDFRVMASRQVNDGGYGFEPSIEVAGDGTVYVTAAQYMFQDALQGQAHGSRLWVSGGNGTSFTEIVTADAATGVRDTPLGAEGDVAVNAQNHAYFTELTFAGAPVSRSTDGGHSWEMRSASAFAVPGGDREWIAAGPQDMVAVTWLGVAPVNFGIIQDTLPPTWVAVSTDGGLTFPVQTQLPEKGISPAGGIDIAPDGTIVVGRRLAAANAPVEVFVSSDGGKTFALSSIATVAERDLFIFVAVAADAANNLYATWSQMADDNAVVLYAASTDRGATWSKPIRVSPPDASAALPWIDAGADGHVAIAYYAAPGTTGDPNDVKGAWVPMVTDITAASTSQPVMSTVAMAAQPVLKGEMCTSGGLCSVLGDYLQVAVGPDGRDQAVWADSDQNIFWGVAGPVGEDL